MIIELFSAALNAKYGKYELLFKNNKGIIS